MNAIAKRESAEVVPADASSVMAMIDRAARDPNVDIDKMERLMGLAERMSAHQAETAYHAAMNECQEEMRPIAADANNPQTHSTYASYAALDRVLRPIYTRHGFSLGFDTADGAPADHVRLVASVAHRAGHKEQPRLDMPSDGKGAKGGDVMTKTHAIGAAVTYGRRYLLGMIFNIAVGADDDGNSNGGRTPSAAVQAAVAAVNACNSIEDLKAWKAKNGAAVDTMDPDDARIVVRLVNDRIRKMKEAAR